MPELNNPLPRWRGFNLIELFSTTTEWQSIFPYEDNGKLLESDFRLISELGFDFVRIPMSYRFWNDGVDLLQMNDFIWRRTDQAVEWGEKYNLHVSLNIHRAPGIASITICTSRFRAISGPILRRKKRSPITGAGLRSATKEFHPPGSASIC